MGKMYCDKRGKTWGKCSEAWYCSLCDWDVCRECSGEEALQGAIDELAHARNTLSELIPYTSRRALSRAVTSPSRCMNASDDTLGTTATCSGGLKLLEGCPWDEACAVPEPVQRALPAAEFPEFQAGLIQTYTTYTAGQRICGTKT